VPISEALTGQWLLGRERSLSFGDSQRIDQISLSEKNKQCPVTTERSMGTPGTEPRHQRVTEWGGGIFLPSRLQSGGAS